MWVFCEVYVCVWLWVYRNSSSPGSVAERPIYQGAISGTERREFREWGIKSQIAIKKKRKKKKTTQKPNVYFVQKTTEKHHRPGWAEAGSRGEEDGGCCCTRLLVEQVGQLGPRICGSSRLRALARRSPAQVGEYGWQANGRARGRRQVGHGARRLLLLRAWSILQRPREEIAAR